MKSKKLIAFLCAAAMTTSAFAGLTITASAASEPVLSLDGSSTTGWTGTVTPTIKTDEGSTDSYLDFLSAADKNSNDTVYNLPAAAQLTDDYVIEFDTLLNTGNGMGKLNQYTQVAFTGANPGVDTADYGGDYARSAQHLIDDNGYTNTWKTGANIGQGYTTQIAASVTSRIELQGKWIFNMKSATPNIATDGNAQIGDGKWVRVRAAVKSGKATITAADSNQVYVDEQQFDADATKLSKILLSFGRADTQNFIPTTATNIKLDNIKVYDGVANAPAFSTTGLRATAIIATPIPAAEKVAGAAPALTIPDRSGIDPVTSVQTSFNSLQVGELAHIETTAQDPVAVGDKMEVQLGSRKDGVDAATYASVVKTADGDNAIKLNANKFSTNGRGPVLSLKDNMSIADTTGTNSVLGFSAYISKTQADGMAKLYLFDDVDLSAEGGNVDGNGVARYVLAVITTEDVKDEEGNNKYTNGDSNIGIHVDEGWHTFTVVVSEGTYRVFVDEQYKDDAGKLSPVLKNTKVGTGDTSQAVVNLPAFAVENRKSDDGSQYSSVLIDNVVAYKFQGDLDKAAEFLPKSGEAAVETPAPTEVPKHTATITWDKTTSSATVSTTEETAFDGVLVHMSYNDDNTLKSVKTYDAKGIVKTTPKAVAFDSTDKVYNGDKIVLWNSLESMIPYGSLTVANGETKPTPTPTATATTTATTAPTPTATATTTATTAPTPTATTTATTAPTPTATTTATTAPTPTATTTATTAPTPTVAPVDSTVTIAKRTGTTFGKTAADFGDVTFAEPTAANVIAATGVLKKVTNLSDMGDTYKDGYFLTYDITIPTVTDYSKVKVSAVSNSTGKPAVPAVTGASTFTAEKKTEDFITFIDPTATKITVTVDLDGDEAAYLPTTYEINLSALKLESYLTIAAFTGTTYGKAATTFSTEGINFGTETNKIYAPTGTLNYVENLTDMGEAYKDGYFLTYLITLPGTFANATVSAKSDQWTEGGVAPAGTFASKTSEDFITYLANNASKITVKVDFDGEGTKYSEAEYTINLASLTKKAASDADPAHIQILADKTTVAQSGTVTFTKNVTDAASKVTSQNGVTWGVYSDAAATTAAAATVATISADGVLTVAANADVDKLYVKANSSVAGKTDLASNIVELTVEEAVATDATVLTFVKGTDTPIAGAAVTATPGGYLELSSASVPAALQLTGTTDAQGKVSLKLNPGRKYTISATLNGQKLMADVENFQTTTADKQIEVAAAAAPDDAPAAVKAAVPGEEVTVTADEGKTFASATIKTGAGATDVATTPASVAGQTSFKFTMPAAGLSTYAVDYQVASKLSFIPFPSAETTILGKNVADLATGVTVTVDSTNDKLIKVTGTSPYVEDFTQFNTADVTEQEGNYVPYAFSFDNGTVKPADVENDTVVITMSGSKAKTWKYSDVFTGDAPWGLLMVKRLADKSEQSEITVDWDGSGTKYTPTTYTVDYSGVTTGAKQYDVTVPTVTGGTLTTDKAKAFAGDTVTLTVAPADGYRLKAGSLKVMNGATEVATTVDTTDSTKYTFTMPAADVSATVQFEYVGEFTLDVDATYIDLRTSTPDGGDKAYNATSHIGERPIAGFVTANGTGLKANGDSLDGSSAAIMSFDASDYANRITSATLVFDAQDKSGVNNAAFRNWGVFENYVDFDTVDANGITGANISTLAGKIANPVAKDANFWDYGTPNGKDGNPAKGTKWAVEMNITDLVKADADGRITMYLGMGTARATYVDNFKLKITTTENKSYKVVTPAVPDSSDGTLAVSARTGVANDEITITPTAATARKVTAVKVKGTAITPVENAYKYTIGADDPDNIPVTAEFTRADALSAAIGGLNLVQKGTSSNYTIKLYDGTGSNKNELVQEEGDVTWSVAAATGTKAEGTTISQAGALTIAADEAATDLVITATYKKDATKELTAEGNSATATFNVKVAATTVYTVTTAATTNGTASVNKTLAEAGDTITVTTTPATGYRVANTNGVVVTPTAAVSTTTANTTYTFPMPAGNASVAVTFEIDTYTLTPGTLSDGPGNSVAISVDSTPVTAASEVAFGKTVTLTPTIAEGSAIKTLTVKGTKTDLGLDDLTKSGDSYTFTMPGENVTVAATFGAPATVTVVYTTDGAATGKVAEDVIFDGFSGDDASSTDVTAYAFTENQALKLHTSEAYPKAYQKYKYTSGTVSVASLTSLTAGDTPLYVTVTQDSDKAIYYVEEDFEGATPTQFVNKERYATSVATDDTLKSKVQVFTAANNAANKIGLAMYQLPEAITTGTVNVEYDMLANTRSALTLGDTTFRARDQWADKENKTKGAIYKSGFDKIKVNDKDSSIDRVFYIMGVNSNNGIKQYGTTDWLHTKAEINLTTKKVTYTVTNTTDAEQKVLYTGTIDYAHTTENETATKFDEIDMYTLINNNVAKLDNLKVYIPVESE